LAFSGGIDVVEAKPVNIVTLRALRPSANRLCPGSRLASRLPRDLKKANRFDGIYLDRLPPSGAGNRLYTGLCPIRTLKSDVSTPYSPAKTLCEQHEESLHPFSIWNIEPTLV
jgi:hypothetical protein